jgi:hypothetical protein
MKVTRRKKWGKVEKIIIQYPMEIMSVVCPYCDARFSVYAVWEDEEDGSFKLIDQTPSAGGKFFCYNCGKDIGRKV